MAVACADEPVRGALAAAAGLLAAGGRVLFIDQHIEVGDEETYLRGSDEIAERKLQDGSRYRIVKDFIDPERVERRLRGLGW